MTFPANAPLQDRLSESVLQTLIEVGPRTLAEPHDYEARASFMWSATLALNTLLCCGVPQDWSTHMIGHELTALYGPAHAETLAVVLPGVWAHELSKKEAKLRQYGQRVWNVATAADAIGKTEEFFQSLDMPTRLGAYKINAEEAAKAVEARFSQRGSRFGEHGDIDGPAAAAILRLRA
jgi:NADP-dependent alcohol dehydrogenase